MSAPILPLNEDSLAKAAAILADGGLVAMPTETVYGLAADAANPDAVARLYAAKGRPQFNPLIAHVNGIRMARLQAEFPPLAEALAAAFWPGALTLVLPTRGDATVCDLARAGLPSVAIRAPAHSGAQALIAAFGGPLAAPSANRSGRISPTRADHVAADLGERIDLILDGGPCEAGIESTILAIEENRAALLRPGAIPAETLADFIREHGGEAIFQRSEGEEGPISSPGQMRAHYAPQARLRLNAGAPQPGEAYLAFGAGKGDLNLSPAGDLIEAARNLFAMLRALDAQASAIAVAPIPETGLGAAINDRLRRAAVRD
jgi:L-threonylcarbamoyladenylate synthase